MTLAEILTAIWAICLILVVLLEYSRAWVRHLSRSLLNAMLRSEHEKSAMGAAVLYGRIAAVIHYHQLVLLTVSAIGLALSCAGILPPLEAP